MKEWQQQMKGQWQQIIRMAITDSKKATTEMTEQQGSHSNSNESNRQL